MNVKSVALFAAAAVLVGGGWYFVAPKAQTPDSVPTPAPVDPKPEPKPKKKPWGNEPCAARVAEQRWRDQGVLNPLRSIGASVGGPVFPDGTEIQCDYPGERHVRNTESKGFGLCVFTSIHHACDWQSVPQLVGMPKWMRDNGIPGGGYPEKVKLLITRMCKEKGVPEPDYLQVEGPASEVFPMLAKATASGRMVCITYSHSPTGRYGGRRISHMVNLPHLDESRAAVLDNNYTGYNAFERMTPKELEQAAGGSRVWGIVFASPGPPPAPHNGKPAPRAAAPQSSCCTRCDVCGCEGCVCDRAKWVRWNDGDDAYWSLYVDGVEQGYYDSAKQAYYRKVRPGVYDGAASKCPACPPHLWALYRESGVDAARLSDRVSYHHGTYGVTRDDFLAAIPDDAHKYRVVAVGSKDRTDALRREWEAYPQDVRDAYILQTYAPDHWHVRDMGFECGKPLAVHVLRQDGLQLHYAEGTEGLATALRRKSPDYKPSAPSPASSASMPLIPAAVVGGVGVLGYLVLRRK